MAIRKVISRSIEDNTVAATDFQGAVTSLSNAGNLTFSSTGQRILGDFTNATLTNRLAFQTSTTNGATVINALPNGTNAVSSFQAFNSADPTNGSVLAIVATATDVRLSSTMYGTGTYLPMTFLAGGSERLRIDTSGNVGIGTTAPLSLGNNLTELTVKAVNADKYANINLIGNRDIGGNQNGVISFWNNFGTLTRTAWIGGHNTGASNTSGELLFGTATSGTLSEKMRITSVGSLQIGSDGATSTLVVTPARTSRLSVTSPSIEVTNGGGSGVYANAGQLVISGRPTDTAGYGGIYFQTGATQQQPMVFDNTGNLIIGSASGSGSRLEVNAADEVVSFNRSAATDGVILRLRKAAGTIAYFSTNTYSLPSDERVKKNIVDIGYGLDFVNSLRPVEYNTIFQDPANETKKNFGLIAQEVEQALDNMGKSTDDVTFLEKIVPENNNDSRYGLGYQNLVPVLIKAIQELKAENDAFKARLDAAGL